MAEEAKTNTKQPVVAREQANEGVAEPSIERDPFLVALMEEVARAVTTEQPPEPEPTVAPQPEPAPESSHRPRPRYSFDWTLGRRTGLKCMAAGSC